MIYSQYGIQVLHNCKKFYESMYMIYGHTFTLLLMVLTPPGDSSHLYRPRGALSWAP